MALRTDRRRRLARPDGYGKNTGLCGDTIEIFLMAPDDRIQAVFYDTDGCLATNACANTVAELVNGAKIEFAWQITPSAICEYLKTLPVDHHHCAELAAGALYRALVDLHANQSKPWRKLYARRSP
jgi:nitrogen fixation NifU-like protein